MINLAFRVFARCVCWKSVSFKFQASEQHANWHCIESKDRWAVSGGNVSPYHDIIVPFYPSANKTGYPLLFPGARKILSRPTMTPHSESFCRSADKVPSMLRKRCKHWFLLIARRFIIVCWGIPTVDPFVTEHGRFEADFSDASWRSRTTYWTLKDLTVVKAEKTGSGFSVCLISSWTMCS